MKRMLSISRSFPLLFGIVLLSLPGCRSATSKVDVALSRIEAELQESEEAFENAIAAEFAVDDPEGVAEQMTQLSGLYEKHIDMMSRMTQLLDDPFPKSEKARFERIMGQIDKRNMTLKEKVNAARKVVEQIKARKTESSAP